jgi:hypothetical protein
MESLSRYGISVKNWAQTLNININSWPTSSLIDWRDILKRQQDLPEHDRRAIEVEKVLSARLDFRGTTMGFSTERDDFRWWLMAGGDVNANRLILSVLTSPSWREDMPRLIRGSLSRQASGRWLTTVANAWGVLALEKFSQLFESQPVKGTSTGQLGLQKQTWDWTKEPIGRAKLFKWPEGKGNVELEHQGSGKPWAVVTSLAAIPLKTPFSNGYRVKKTIVPIVQKAISRAFVWNVRPRRIWVGWLSVIQSLAAQPSSEPDWAAIHSWPPREKRERVGFGLRLKSARRRPSVPIMNMCPRAPGSWNTP